MPGVVEEPGHGGQDEAVVVGRREGAHPAVEYLHGGRSGRHLVLDRRHRQVDEPLEEGVPQLRLGVHQRLRALVLTGGAAFDEVAGQGERTTGEADHGHLQLLREHGDGLPGPWHVLPGDERAQTAQVVLRTEGMLDHRSHARDDVDPHAGGPERGHDVGEDHGRVHAVPAHRLHRDLGGQLRVGETLQDGSVAPEGPVLREGAAGLAHEPDRGVAYRLPGAGREEGIGLGGRGSHGGRR